MKKKRITRPINLGRILVSQYISSAHYRSEAPGRQHTFPEAFMSWAHKSGIRAFEFNNQNHRQQTAGQCGQWRIAAHYYWPFQYINSSRFCSAPADYCFSAKTHTAPCARECRTSFAVISKEAYAVPLYASGNRYLMKEDSPCPDGLPGNGRIINNDFTLGLSRSEGMRDEA